MGKVLIGVATAALWFVLAHAANAERVCRQVCDSGTCVSRCVGRPDITVIRDREHYRDDEGPGVVHVPSVEIDR
jgi:hypothetical protein